MTAGAHRVQLRIDWCSSRTLTLDAPAGGTVTLRCEPPNPLGALYWITFGRNRYIRLAVAEDG